MIFWRLFRLIFVFFFLYLLGDAFYRWDGFRYYASFLDFLPSVALISFLWSMLAVLATIISWMLLILAAWICRCVKFKVSTEILILNAGFLIFIYAVIWKSKKLIWPDVQMTQGEKLIVVISAVLLSVFLTWLLRHKAESLIVMVFERITPLVWLFGITVCLSLPLVTYYALWETTDKVISSRTAISPKNDRHLPNIILITFDAMTAKDMSVYGYHKPTTPFILEWAKSATVFKRCEAAANATYETVPSLMTGKRVWSHRRYHSDAGKPVSIDSESMPLLLKDSGYYNMAFIANEIASVQKMGLSDSFEVKPLAGAMKEPVSLYGFLRKYLFEYFGTKIMLYDWILKEDFILHLLLPDNFIKYPYKTEYPVKKVFDMFLSELRNNNQAPFFAWIHLFPPHAPYLPPEHYVGLFDISPKFRTAKSQYPLINPRYYAPEKQPDADILRGRYDEFIRYCDEQFEYLIEQLALINKLNDTVIILSSDHGESFEHGFLTHGSQQNLFEELTHIPLIIKVPAQTEGKIIDIPVEMTDIPATILDLAQISVPPWMEGRSLSPFLRGKELQPRPVYSMFLEEVPTRGQREINKGMIAVWEGNYKLIHNIASKKTLLFNLALDPNELDDIFSTEVETGQYLLGLIQDNLKNINEIIKSEE